MINLFSLLGLCLGSFFNVLVSRIHEDTEIWKGRSKCDSCGYALRWYNLIPILSYVFQGGRCQMCKAKIPTIHLYAEIIMGLGFFVISFIAHNICTFEIFVMTITVITLGFCAISDKVHGEVFTTITDIASLFIALLTVFFYIDNKMYDMLIQRTLIYSLIVITCILFARIDKEKHLGYGDYHLFCLMLLSASFMNVWLAIFIGSTVGLILILPKYIAKTEQKCNEVAFAPFLYYGYLITILISFGGMI